MIKYTVLTDDTSGSGRRADRQIQFNFETGLEVVFGNGDTINVGFGLRIVANGEAVVHVARW